MNLQLYNTKSKRIEVFEPLSPPHVGLYTCGMTVYYFAHIGHIRTYISSDVLRRTLEFIGYQVRHVMNVTDVGHMTSDSDRGEDKVELEARREGKSPWEIARFYEDHFFKTLDQVNILKPHVICRATEHIADQIDLIKRLEEKGYTYKTNVGVIFDTSKFKDYAKFACLHLQGQQAGARVPIDLDRESEWDFALWITNQPNHIMQWDSPWGRGFPGWHIECSAMSMKYLGEEIDIHTGGIDHIPVHHTNEIAQSEAATGKTFVQYWFHSAFLNVEGTKMSKSLRNLYTLDDIIGHGFSPLALRYLFLGSSYRKPQNFNWEALKAAQKSLVRLWEKFAEYPRTLDELLHPEMNAFEMSIGSNLNTSKALALIWDLLESGKSRSRIASTLLKIDQILGLDLLNAESRLEELNKIRLTSNQNENVAKSLAEKRDALRKQKKFKEADLLRDEILELGFSVEDTPGGTLLKPKEPSM